MLANISWTDYIIAVIVLSVIYYAFVAVRYYADEVKSLFSAKRKLKIKTVVDERFSELEPLEFQSPYGNDDSSFQDKSDDEFAEVEELIERLKTAIAEASLKKADPQEFRQYLHMVLKEYPTIKKSPLRSSINELIASECEKYTAVALREDEADALWDETV